MFTPGLVKESVLWFEDADDGEQPAARPPRSSARAAWWATLRGKRIRMSLEGPEMAGARELTPHIETLVASAPSC